MTSLEWKRPSNSDSSSSSDEEKICHMDDEKHDDSSSSSSDRRLGGLSSSTSSEEEKKNDSSSSSSGDTKEKVVNLKAQSKCPKYKITYAPFHSLQTKIIKKKIKSEQSREFLCLICYKPMTDSDSVFILEDCRHLYHNECVMAWFVDQDRCPTCSFSPEY